jgi:hypothetical protein
MPKSRSETTGNEGGAAKKPRQTVTGWEEQSAEERKVHLQALSVKLKEFGLTHVLLRDATSLLAQSETAGTLSEHHTLTIDGLYSPSQQGQFDDFIKFADTVLTDAQNMASPGPSEGQPAPATKAFSAKLNAEVPVAFGGGQVVLLVFWAPSDISAVNQIRKIAEEHKDWVSKARIVCVSTADENEQDEDLQDMPLVTQLWRGREAALLWGAVSDSLEYILVDASGVIARRADPRDFNVSKDIAGCIAGQKVGTEEKKLSEGQWAAFTNEAQRALLIRLSHTIKDAGLTTLGLRSDAITTYSAEGQKGLQEARLILDGVLLQSREAAMVQIVNELHQAKVLDVDYEFTTMFKLLEDEGDDEGDENRVPVLPPNCQECKGVLAGVKARYLCACCPAPYYVICDACEAHRATSTHAAHHVFFVVPTAGWNEEVHFSVGDLTTWPVFADAISSKEPDVFCDGCSQSLESGTRFDCAQCADHDLCAKCWQNQKPNDPHSGHVWIKIHEPRGCRLTVGPDDGMDLFDGGDEGDFGEEDEQDPSDTRIQLQ